MRWLVLAFLVGCGTAHSQVGPYVKHVARNGDWLVIHKCMIVLDGVELGEASCTVEQMPLRALPQAQPPMVQPGAPPPSGMPVAPPVAPPR
jgi:hypothetical protein